MYLRWTYSKNCKNWIVILLQVMFRGIHEEVYERIDLEDPFVFNSITSCFSPRQCALRKVIILPSQSCMFIIWQILEITSYPFIFNKLSVEEWILSLLVLVVMADPVPRSWKYIAAKTGNDVFYARLMNVDDERCSGCVFWSNGGNENGKKQWKTIFYKKVEYRL